LLKYIYSVVAEVTSAAKINTKKINQRQMEKQVKERRTPVNESTQQPQAEQKTEQARLQWEEQEILELQEKARHFQRHYPAGGYQGL
jgi:hypothetical protein